MGDLWNPFDKDNPVYVAVAKKAGLTRRMAQMQVASLVVLAVLAVEAGRKKGLYDQTYGFRRYRNYGINGMTAMRHRLNHRK